MKMDLAFTVASGMAKQKQNKGHNAGKAAITRPIAALSAELTR